MTYKPIRAPSTRKNKKMISFGPTEGEQKGIASELLKSNEALTIKNYLISNKGKLIKRKGLETVASVATNSPITLLEKYCDNFYIFGYDNKVAVLDLGNETITNIKTDFTTSDPFSGVRYGDYFFVCNGGDKIGRITRTLDYDGQTGDFTVGNKVTGGTSGATAIVLEDSDSGSTGTLTLGEISGDFEDDEALTDSGSASAYVNGTLSWAYTEVSSAPKAKVLYTFGGRLFAGNTETDPTEVRYSAVDDGTNPPFTSWTAGTGASDPGKVKFRSAGAVRAIGSLGEQVVVLYDEGKAGFRIVIIDSGGSLVQDNPVDFERIDFGGARGATITPQGIFYANEAGVWQMVSGGSDEPNSAKERLVSIPLGDMDSYDFEDADIIYNEKLSSVLITCRENSSANNKVLVYNLNFDAWSEIMGWNLSRFLSDGVDVYAGNSGSVKIHKLFSGNSDDNEDISTELVQEIFSEDPTIQKTLLREYIKGYLSPSTKLELSFDVYDRKGKLTENKAKLYLQAEGDDVSIEGIGSGSWGITPFGGDTGGESGLIETLGGSEKVIRNFTRLRMKVREQSVLPHEINWIKVVVKEGKSIRSHNLTNS